MKQTFKLFLAAILVAPLILACTSGDSKKMEVKYEKFTLDNGLKVILHEDHSDPVVGVAIQFHVGSGREKVGKTGFAHFFEHMLFQRSENLPRNTFFQKISAMGGDFNGGTWQDGTIYYEVVPRDAIEKVLWMESDRMGFFINTVTQAGLDREVDVILNEKRQNTDNSAYGQAEVIEAQELYPAGHPYSWSVIGKMDDIRSATIDDVKEFYGTYYIPQNATLSIAGDFDPVQMKELVTKYFGEVKKGADIAKPKVQNITLAQTKKVMYEDPFAPLPMLSISYPAVQMGNDDEQALSMLGRLLGGNKQSPLYKTIVEGNLAPNVRAGLSSSEVAGTFGISLQAFAGTPLDSVYAAIEKAFAMFEKSGVDPVQMQMIKAMQERNVYNQMSSVQNKAMSFAMNNEFSGKPDSFIDELEQFKALTAEDVMRVYDKYIKGHTYFALSMVPKGQPQLALSGSTPAVIEVENVEDASASQNKSAAGAIVDDDFVHTPSAFDRSVEPAYLSNSPAITLPTMWTKTMPNGMKLAGITQNEIPLVNFEITLKGGKLLDPAGKTGVAYLNAALMNEGTALHSAEEIEQSLNMLGASIRVSSGNGSTSIYGSCLSRNFTQTMSILKEMLMQPKFDETVLAREKKKAEANIQRNLKEPSQIALKATRELLFGETSILTQAAYGTVESLESITMDDIKAYYAANFTPALAQFSVAGDMTQADCEKAIATLVSDWNGSAVSVPAPTFAQGDSKGKTYFIDYPGAKQSFIMVSRLSVPYSNPDYYALEVLNFKLGSGSNGQLFDVLRLQRGYTYGAYSSFNATKDYGMFQAYSSVQANVTKESVDIFHDIFNSYGANFTEDMLNVTKDAMIRAKAFSFETQGALLNMLVNIYLEDLPADYVKAEEKMINGITLDKIKSLASEYLDPASLTYVIVGDAKTQMKKINGAIAR